MDNEKNNLLKLIGSKLAYAGVIICFFLITSYFIVAGQTQQTEPVTMKHDELNMESFKPNLTTATTTIKNESVEDTPTINDETVEETTTIPIEEESNITIDKSSFALLQNNPALGKSSLEESQNEPIEGVEEGENLPTDQNDHESSITDPEQSNEFDIENPTPEQQEDESITIEDSTVPSVENDPALDKSVVTQLPKPSFPYSEKLPIPFEHQEYLYGLCVQYGLEYEKVLAVMEHESKFNPNAIGATSDFGYFQINSINHSWLSEKLGTPNDPLDPYVNMQWGTFFLADLISYWEGQGLTGIALDDAVLSSYNKGKTGFRRTGKATNYVNKVRESYALIQDKYM